MLKSNKPFDYDEWFGLTSDGGEMRQMPSQVVPYYNAVLDVSFNPRIRTCTKATVGPFDDERFTCYIRSYKNLDMSRWDALTSAGAKLLAVEEKQGDGSIVYQLYAGEDDADSDEMVSKLLQVSNQKRLTQWGVDEFQRLCTKARQEFELHRILSQPDFLQHDSSLESVIERLPADLITSIGYDYVKDFVEGHIRVLKVWEKKRLYYDFKSFLPECDWITMKMPTKKEISSILTRLREDVTFLKRGFDMIPFQEIICEVMSYIGHFGFHEVSGIEVRKTAYKNLARHNLNIERSSLEKRRQRFPSNFTDPIHFLVFIEHEKHYTIQDPVVEVAKIQAFFNYLPLGDGSYIETTSPLMGAEEEESEEESIYENDDLDADNKSQGEGQIFSYESWSQVPQHRGLSF